MEWLSSLEMDTMTRVQNLDEAVCIFTLLKTLGIGRNLNILISSMGK